MIVCHACHRHFRAQDSQCPFCGTGLRTTNAPVIRGLVGAAALAIGLTLSGCDDDEGGTDTTGETGSEAETTAGESGTDTATDSTTDSGGADYGGAPAPEPEQDF